MSYELVNAAARYTVEATTSGSDYLVTISAATSAGYTAGTYDWRARVSKAGDVYTVGTGRLTVNTSFASAADGRSPARQALEAIEATLAGRATSATEMYEIQTATGMRKLKYVPVADLLVLRDRYRMDVAAEDAAMRSAAGLQNPGRIFVRHV